jgi:GT2 family glycosyltransferase
VPRPDVAEHIKKTRGVVLGTDRVGFVGFARSGTVAAAGPVSLRITSGAQSISSPAFEPRRLTKGCAKDLLGFVAEEGFARRPALFEDVGPMIDAHAPARPSAGTRFQSLQFGTPPAAPDVSVVVPLYGRIDFLEHQLAHFSADPDFAKAELIYVLDDPRLIAEATSSARFWHRLHGVPFRLLLLEKNLGYAGSNNLGAAEATAEKLLLLNSDVIPKAPGWLSKLAAKLDTLPNAGIVSPRLLFPSGALQYEGMVFRMWPHICPFYLNDHPGKGLPPNRSSAAREVAAATGACLMMATSLYRQFGGLDEGFVMGDFEDSDLSLRVRGSGRKLWCLPDIELYHLERQSIVQSGSSDLRQCVTFYNAWRHHKRWASTIAPNAPTELAR